MISFEFAKKDGTELKPTRSANEVRAAHTTIHHTSYFESMVHLIKGNVGAGVFAMGIAIQHAGMLNGFFLTLFLGAMATYNIHVLINLAKHITDILALEFLPNFPETIELCFRFGPPKMKQLTGAIRFLTKMFIILTQLGFCSIYTLFVSNTIQKIMYDYYPDVHITARIYVCIVAVPMLLTVLITSLKFLTPVSFTSVCFLLIGIILCVYACVITPFVNFFDRPQVAPITHWPVFFGTVMFSFEGIALTVPLYNEMAEPELFLSTFGVLNVGMFIVVCATAGMGLLGYWKFGEEIKGSISLNFEGTAVGQALQIFIAAGILLSYAIQFHVAVDVTWWDIVEKYNIQSNLLKWELLYRFILSIGTFTAAAAIPYLHILVAMIGAVCSTTLALLFPAICDIVLRSAPVGERIESDNVHSRRFRFALDIITLILAFTGWVTGFICSIYELIVEIRENPEGGT